MGKESRQLDQAYLNLTRGLISFAGINPECPHRIEKGLKEYYENFLTQRFTPEEQERLLQIAKEFRETFSLETALVA